MPRPSKLTPSLREAILGALRDGNSRTASAAYVGVDRETLARWTRRNAAFRRDVEQAEAAAEVFCVSKLQAAIRDGSTEDARWWLERRRHQEWGRRDRLEITATVRRLAEQAGLSDAETEAAVQEAERYLREVRRGSPGA